MKRRLRLEEVSDPAVLRAMQAVPREEFVPRFLRDAAYDDRALPIDCGQTISQPAVVAYMTEKLRLAPGQRVLEVGTGSGYQAAVLAEIVREVYSIERIPALAQTAAARLARLGYGNVHVRTGDGAQGWPEAAPFDAIMVTAATAKVPPALLAQLGTGGRLILPEGGPHEEQVLVLLERKTPTDIVRTTLWAVRFVPLLPG
ncbi:MAG: protein-L-isoaspartate(D-aspartate) O-methyltransferase [Opitutaceae bacterium]|nr:protein-L-isoaspartate(D-aspartate) O-methyltransferase [Opitutaceae bacterium]